MLTITKEEYNEYEANVYINGKLYSDIGSLYDSDNYFCQKYEDFILLSQYSFQELINSRVEDITCNDESYFKGTICYFYYLVRTKLSHELIKAYEQETGKNEFTESNSINTGNYISATLNFRYDDWKKLYSIKEFQSFLHKKITTNNFLGSNTNIEWRQANIFDMTDTLVIQFRYVDDNQTPISYIEKYMPHVNNLINEVIIEMDNQYSLDIYSTYFNFPPAYKTSCKQYLMYFTQFLLDLGISVNTEVKDTPEGTFFSVIPQDKNEAIENIKELLAIYMDAPNSLKDNDLAIHQSDIAITQFHANILHLRSQLAFANTLIEMKQATIQLKDATIQSLNLTNYQLSEEIKHQASKDEESIISGVVSVKKVETYGFNINLPEILRRLKRKL